MRYKMPIVGLLMGALVALEAIQSYYVREMLAVLLFFSIAFSIVGVMVLILVLMDRGLYCALTWAGSFTADAELRLHRGWEQAEQFGRKHLHHAEKSVER